MASKKAKIDKNVLNAAKIAACRALFIKYNGRSHSQIEREMRELGFTDFSRRILYPRTKGRGKRAGWIAEFGWTLTNAGGTGVGERADRAPFGGVGGHDTCVPPDFPDFQAWLKRVSPGMTWDWRHQVYLYERLQRITDGECKRLMINMPPRHGKSELVTVRYCAWRIRRDPAMKIILASYGQQLANTFSRSIKRVICEDLALEPAPESAVGQETRDQSREPRGGSGKRTPDHGLQTHASTPSPGQMFPFATQRPINTAAQWGTAVGGGLRAVGVGGGVTGFGADLIVIDDPVKSRAEAESETFRERLWDWYNNDLYTRLEPDGSIILIQTRWHEDDLAGRLIKQMNEGGEEWEIVDLPAIAVGADEVGSAGKAPGSEPPASTGRTKLDRRLDGFHRLTEQTDNARDLEAAPLNSIAVPPAYAGGSDPDAGGSDAEPKPRVIGFPRLYSRLESDWSASVPLANTGSSGVTAPESETPDQTEARGRGQDVRLSVDWRRVGDALCPERYDTGKLEQIRSQLGMYGFSALFQQKPTPADGAIFKRQWLRNIVEAAPPGLRWFRGYDLAISTRTTADYTASFRVAMDELGFLYIADGFRERIEYPEQRRFILERIRSERNTLHGIEDSAGGRSIVQDLRREPRMLRHSFKAVPVVGDKLTRALKWSPLAEAGKLKLVRGAWIQGFIHELVRFPKGKHDDQIDAVSIAVHMMSETPDRKLYTFR